MCVSSCENAPFNHWKVSDNEGGSSWERLEVSELASGKSLSSDSSVTSDAGSVVSDMSASHPLIRQLFQTFENKVVHVVTVPWLCQPQLFGNICMAFCESARVTVLGPGRTGNLTPHCRTPLRVKLAFLRLPSTGSRCGLKHHDHTCRGPTRSILPVKTALVRLRVGGRPV